MSRRIKATKERKPKASIPDDSLEHPDVCLKPRRGSLSDLYEHHTSKRLTTWMLLLMIGLLTGWLFSNRSPGLQDMQIRALQLIEGLDMESLRSFTESQVDSLRDRFASLAPFRPSSTFRPHHAESLKPKHPVIMIPGFITTGLEVWESESCVEDAFRQRIWGGLSMLKHLVKNPTCWLKHMSLSESGLDHPKIRLRPAGGLEGGDYFIGHFWVWGQIIQTLGSAGYDHTTMMYAGYDWRLRIPHLELRDRFFSRLAHDIEGMVDRMGHKALLVTHSYGAMVLHFFLAWAEHHKGIGWVDKYIANIYHTGAAFLGVQRAVGSLWAGEMKDTGIMNGISDLIVGPEQRADLWRTWGSLIDMIPKGGNTIWSKFNHTVDGVQVPIEQLITLMTEKIPALKRDIGTLYFGKDLVEPPSDLICPDPLVPSACYRKEWSNVLGV